MNFNTLGEVFHDAPEAVEKAYVWAPKFDVGEWKAFPKEMIHFGSMLCEDHIFKLPFPVCVFGGAYDFLEQQLVYGNAEQSLDDADIKWEFKRDPESAKHVGFWTKNLAIQAWDLSEFDGLQRETRKEINRDGVEKSCDFLLTVFVDYGRDRGWVQIGSIVLDQGCDIFWVPNGDVLDAVEEKDRYLRSFMIYAKAKAALWGLFAAVAALASKSTEQKIIPAPEKLNKARAKKGKPPIYEYRQIKIGRSSDMPHTLSGRSVEGRASPRLHWRRGHYRTLSSSIRVPVAPALVGVSDNGFLDKDYLIK